jgi:ubiquinone/menaquinone biosynthesis C-methylase UbiE
MTTRQGYLFADKAAELERLRFQARIWEPEADALLDRIGVASGWNCIDLGCGAMGILGPLSRRVGPKGHVIGVDLDAMQLAGAREFVQAQKLSNVEILEQDAYGAALPRESFDLTHVRFVITPTGRGEALLREMVALTRPGGVVAIEEPDTMCWNCYPTHPAWTKLKGAVLAAFVQAGGDPTAGQRTYGMLHRARLQRIQVRASTLALAEQHPYNRLLIQFATMLRQRILDGNLLSELELDQAIAECEQVLSDPETLGIMVVTQVWGYKPNQ